MTSFLERPPSTDGDPSGICCGWAHWNRPCQLAVRADTPNGLYGARPRAPLNKPIRCARSSCRKETPSRWHLVYTLRHLTGAQQTSFVSMPWPGWCSGHADKQVGQELEKGGFTSLDALDSSPEILERTEARSSPSLSFRGRVGHKMAARIPQTPQSGGKYRGISHAYDLIRTMPKLCCFRRTQPGTSTHLSAVWLFPENCMHKSPWFPHPRMVRPRRASVSPAKTI